MSLAQLSRILPLPEVDLQQVLDYASTLSKQEAVEHFNSVLGDSPQAVEFISSFNARRQDPAVSSSQPAASEISAVPKVPRKTPKKKAPLHTPAPRQIQDSYAAQGTAYKKKSEDDYMPKRPSPAPTPQNTPSQDPKPAAVHAPTPRPPPSAAGSLISDFKPSKSSSSSRNASQNNSRTSSPLPVTKAKVTITGGTSMHGASGPLSELDAAIRSLEISTNSTLLDNEKRKCNCIAVRHPLLTAAPNCLNCGKVICVKEGLGPCTFCGSPLLSAVEVQGMIRELREERGRAKMALDASAHRRADVARQPALFAAARDPNLSPAEARAKEHRDKLLAFQAQNARRTTVRDEAADFDTPASGTSMWATPAERARQLKAQQRVLAEQEWNARPEYEKRRQVVSIDLVKGKVVKKMSAVEKPAFAAPDSRDDEEEKAELPLRETSGNSGGGTFSRNPLLGGMIKPVWNPPAGGKVKGKGKGGEQDEEAEIDQGDLTSQKRTMWRRVQDDLDDNEAVILDGGALGGGIGGGGGEREEPDCG